jgi:hypothetical protein
MIQHYSLVRFAGPCRRPKAVLGGQLYPRPLGHPKRVSVAPGCLYGVFTDWTHDRKGDV